MSAPEEPITQEKPTPEIVEIKTPDMADRSLMPVFYIVAGALALRLFFNFCGGHPNAYASADASEYLRYTDALSRIISGQAAGPIATTLKEFVITGPSLPVFLLIATILTGQHFDPAASATALAAQSLISALTAGLIYLIAKRLFDPRTATYAGTAAALYPAFIVNSGRLYSETFATFVECLALLLLIRGFFPGGRARLNNFSLGLTLIILQLSRSAMVLLTAAAIPVVFLQNLYNPKGEGSETKNFRGALVATAMLLLGTITMLTPWFIFEKAAFNKITLAVDRVGHYNLFVGTNTAIGGFLSYPYPDGRGIEEKSFPTLIKEAYAKSPSRFIRLMMDKPARLFKAPWNDFRAEIGPVTYKLQVAFHQAIILLFIAGLLLTTVVGREVHEGRKMWGRLTLLLAFALNLPYLAFITVPRYNLTAMPFVIIFAAAGLHAIVQMLLSDKLARAPKALAMIAVCMFFYLRDDLKDAFVIGQEPVANFFFVQGQDMLSKGIISTVFGLGFFVSLYLLIGTLNGHKKIARAATVLTALITLPLLAVPQRANGRAGEGVMTLERAGECISGSIPFKPTQGEREWYLLLDCDSPTLLNRDLDLTINGTKITGPLIPGISALDDWHYIKLNGNRAYLECGYIYDCMSQPTAITNLDLRQWYYIPVSAAFIAEAQRRGCLNVSLNHKHNGPTRLYSAALSKDGSATIPSRDIYSWEKCFYGVENDSGLTDSRYDEKVPARQARWKMSFNNKSEDMERFDLNLRLLGVKTATDPSENASPIENQSCTAGGAQQTSLALPQQLTKTGPLTLIEAKLSYPAGKAPLSDSTGTETPKFFLDWTGDDGKKITMPLPWIKHTPDTLHIAVPCDLSKIAGSDIRAHVITKNPNCAITLSAKKLGAHPIFGAGELF